MAGTEDQPGVLKRANAHPSLLPTGGDQLVVAPPGEDPTAEEHAPNKVTIERAIGATLTFSEQIPREALHESIYPEQMHIAPIQPYNIDGQGESPIYRVYRREDPRRRLLGHSSLSFTPSLYTEMLLVEETSMQSGQVILIGLPEGEEEIHVSFGEAENGQARPGLHIRKDRNGYVAIGDKGEAHGISETPLAIGTHVFDITRTEQTRGKTINTINFEEQIPQCIASVVIVEGKQYILLEDVSEKRTSITVPKSIVDRTKQALKDEVSVEYATESLGVVSLSDPEHAMENQDAVGITDNGTIIVADGISGSQNGYFASRFVRDVISAVDNRNAASTDSEKVRQLLVEEVQCAHSALLNAEEDGNTTVAVARVVTKNKGKKSETNTLVWANVGDTRVYVFRASANAGERRLVQISTDDGVMRRWERRADQNGWLTLKPSDPDVAAFKEFGFQVDEENNRVLLETWRLEQLRAALDTTSDFTMYAEGSLPLVTFLKRNISDGLRKRGSSNEPEEYHSGTYQLQKGDRILVASDGIFDNLSDADIVAVLEREGSPIAGARSLAMASRSRFGEYLALKSELPEGEEPDIAFQRVKPDDTTIVIQRI